jgi:DNA-binding PadR family transcriptional regulator
MTNAELAILSLIGEAPRHGYEVEQVIEARGMREWTDVGFSSIYYVLNKLEKRGWVVGRKGETIGQGAPRKVFTITPEGQRALKEAILNALSSPERNPANFQIGLANLRLVDKRMAIDALKQHVQTLRSRADHIRARRSEQEPLPFNVAGMFDLSMRMIAAQQEWLKAFIRQWERQDE